MFIAVLICCCACLSLSLSAAVLFCRCANLLLCLFVGVLIFFRFIGRYATYTGPGFQEGVSLTCVDEVIRLRKYAYGACEMLLNKFKVRTVFRVWVFVAAVSSGCLWGAWYCVVFCFVLCWVYFGALHCVGFCLFLCVCCSIVVFCCVAFACGCVVVLVVLCCKYWFCVVFYFGCLLVVLWRCVVFGVLAVLAGWRVGFCSRACSLFVSVVLLCFGMVVLGGQTGMLSFDLLVWKGL